MICLQVINTYQLLPRNTTNQSQNTGSSILTRLSLLDNYGSGLLQEIRGSRNPVPGATAPFPLSFLSFIHPPFPLPSVILPDEQCRCQLWLCPPITCRQFLEDAVINSRVMNYVCSP
jgi:hypothetical protein